MKEYYVYILLCSDKSYYIGVTNNLDRRIGEHEGSINYGSYVSKRLPAQLVYYEAFQDIRAAIDREKQLKGWTRAKKMALIEENIEKLKELSKSYAKRKEL